MICLMPRRYSADASLCHRAAARPARLRGRDVGLSLACCARSAFHCCAGARTSRSRPDPAVRQTADDRRSPACPGAHEAIRPPADAREACLDGRESTRTASERGARIGFDSQLHGSHAHASHGHAPGQAGAVAIEKTQSPNRAIPTEAQSTDRAAPHRAACNHDAASHYASAVTPADSGRNATGSRTGG
jgi:hypothetical protein